MDFTRYGAEIAAIVGLFTIAGFLWRLFVKIRDTMDVVSKMPPKLEETGKRVETLGEENRKRAESLGGKIDGVDRKVDLMAGQHLMTNEQTHNSLAELKQAHSVFDGRLREVEYGVKVLMDRKDREERPDA